MTLFIDSSQNTHLTLRLDDQEKIIDYDTPRQQDILRSLTAFLNEMHVSLSDLTAIEVATGPGKFTSLRVGIAVAQALSFGLQIPINSKPPGTSIDPEYGAPPNITIKKE